MPHECTDCGRSFDDGSKEMLSGCPDCGGTTFQFRPPGADPPSEEPPDPPAAELDGVARTVGTAASKVRNIVSSGPSEPPADRDAGPATQASDATTEPATPVTDSGTDSSPAPAAESGSDPAADDIVIAEETEAFPPWPDEADRGEDRSQTSARNDIASPEELPSDGKRKRNRPPVPDPRPISARPDEEDAETVQTVDVDELEPTAEADEDTWAEGTTTEGDARPSLSELRKELNEQFESIRVLEPGQYELNLMELYDREEYIIALQEDGRYTIQLPERWDED